MKKTDLYSRMAVLRCLEDVLDHGKPLESSFDKHARKLTPQDRAFAYALLLCLLRHYGWSQQLLRKHLRKKLPHSKRWLSRILLIAIAQICWMRVPEHAAISTTLHWLDIRNATGFKKLAHGVLSNISKNKDTLLSELHALDNLPRWLKEAWLTHYGETTATSMARACTQAAPIDLSGDVSMLPAESGQRLESGSWRLHDHPNVASLAGYDDGAWWVQSASAALPVALLGDIAGKRVLEIGSAPGGKTAQIIKAGAEVTALDRSESRLKRLRDNLSRLQLKASEVICKDALDYTPSQPYDLILIDAPCSATGTLRHHPELAWVKGAHDITELATLQHELLARITAWATPGATIIYCTCSLEPQENQEQVASLLAEQAALTRQPYQPEELTPNLQDCISETGDIHINLTDLAEQGGMDGFFMARLTMAG